MDQTTISEALSDHDSTTWQNAIQYELSVIDAMNTWEPAFLPKEKNLTKTKWVFQRKKDSDGNVVRHRARLVAKGYEQIPNVDFEAVFSPVASYTTFRFMMVLKVLEGYGLHQIDVRMHF